jgi:hypothetical protein
MDPGPFFYIYITTYCKHHLLSANIIYLLQTNIFFHTIRLILFSKPVILTTSLQVGSKYLGCVVCRFHVAAGAGSLPCQKPVSNNLQKWFLSPTGRLNFGFITEGKLTTVLITPSSLGSQLVCQHRTINKFSGVIAREKEDFYKGSLSLPIFLLCYCFA